MIVPKTYLDRETRKSNKYIFISYSSLDRETIYPVLNELFDKNVNYWYDSEMLVGDDWEKRAKDRIYDENCVGVIVFLSVNSCLSEPVYKEVNMLIERNISLLYRFT